MRGEGLGARVINSCLFRGMAGDSLAASIVPRKGAEALSGAGMTDIATNISSTDADRRWQESQAAIVAAAEAAGRRAEDVTLLAVSKTRTADEVRRVMERGHRHFGENRVQEAAGKWPALKAEAPDVRLHLIGPLQTNKVKQAVALFDVIETLDREKLARKLADEMAVQDEGAFPRLYIQVNTGAEPQKAGLDPQELDDFAALCRDLRLPVDGLMCIPPFDEAAGPHFALLSKLAARLGLPNLSMGMSGDYATAIALGATHIRLGTALFGPRPTQ